MGASRTASALERLAPDAINLIVGTPLEQDQGRIQLTPNQALKSADTVGDTVPPDSEAQPEANHGLDGSAPLPTAAILPATRTTIGGEQGTRKIVRVRLGDLRPNPINATIYGESLLDENLRDLADNMARYGQQDPIIADASLMILDGERRWRVLQLIHVEYADVIMDIAERSADEMEDLVLDAFSLKRKPSVFEQVRLYKAAVRSYTRRYGRAPGRPRKLDKVLSGFWDANKVREEAATAAGFGSRETARQAIRVIERADPATKDLMLSRAMSISAAHATLQAAEADSDETGRNAETHDDNPEEYPASSPPTHADVRGEIEEGESPRPSTNERGEQRSPRSSGSGAEPQPPVDEVRESEPEEAPEQKPSFVAAEESTSTQESEARDVGKPAGTGPDRAEKTGNGGVSSAKERPQLQDDRVERRSFERALSAMVAYVATLSERDHGEARRARDEAVLRLDAAVGSPAAGEEPTDIEAHESDEEERSPDEEEDEIDDLTDEGGDDHDPGDDEEDLTVVEQGDDEPYMADSDEDEEDLDQEDDDGEPTDPIDAEVARILGRKRRRNR